MNETKEKVDKNRLKVKLKKYLIYTNRAISKPVRKRPQAKRKNIKNYL